ncbi:YciI family protein [Dyella sp.]|uniref:YciI family protein n=1 Tax=Dyella sp. TaxID=1869338 RepID=UPI003F81E39C
MKRQLCLAIALCGLGLAGAARAADPVPSTYDAALARRLGADARGMRSYVLVILRTGPTRVPDGNTRDAMFAGHFANIQRLADAGKLVLAGPFDDADGDWRGLFVFAVDSIDQARALVASDPVIRQGEMVAEYHRWYGSAAAMMLPEIHRALTPPAPTGGEEAR